MGRLVKGYDLLVVGLAVVAAIIPLFLLLGTVLSVFVRISDLDVLFGIQAYIEYGLFYCTILVAPWLVRTRGHVFVEVFLAAVSAPVRIVTEKSIYALCVVVSLIVVYYSGDKLLYYWATGQYETRAVDMPLWVLFLPMPVSFLLIAVEFARYLLGYDTMYLAASREGG